MQTGARFGAYDVVAKLGEGGMGEVYRARDSRLDRDVALKVLPGSFASDPERLARFEREARTLASLNHPHIAQIYGLEASGGETALVMELVDAEDLAARLSRGSIPVDEALPIAKQIAEALEAAHEQGIIHRDLKPANIKVRDDGTVKVLDFGLAKLAPGAAGQMGATAPSLTSPAMTQAGVILGTAAYMAPEQARGKPVDRRADVWAFGVVLFEMLTGRRAFEGDDLSITLANVLKQDVDWDALPADLPPPVRRLLRHCLEKNPAKRLDSMRAVMIAIDDAAEAAPIPPRRAWITHRRSPGRMLAIGAMFAVAVGLSAGAALLVRDTSRTAAASVTEVEYRRLTFDPGFIFAARFAGDGRTVVYSADWDGRGRDLFMASVDSRNARSLGVAGADLLALGASGEMAMLLDSRIPAGNPYTRSGSLARGSLTGGLQRAELTDVAFADLAADGTLAVIRLTETEALLEFPVGHVLARSPLIGGNYGDRFFVTARVSPDGRRVATMVPEGHARWRAQVFERGGAMVAEDTEGVVDWWGLAWRTPTEVWIAGTESAGRQTTVFALGLDGSRRPVFRAHTALTLHDVSSDGDMLSSFDRFGGQVEIIEPGGEIRDLTWQDGGVNAGISDAGLVLVNQEGDGGGPNATALAMARGSAQPVRIAEGSAQSVSPDGTRALVMHGQRAHMVPIGPGQPESFDLDPSERLGWTGWHPDGRLILSVVRLNGSRGTYARDTAGGALTPLLPAGVWPSGGRLISPDGRWIIAIGADGLLVQCAIPASGCEPLPGRRPGDEVAGWLADNRTVIVVNDRTLPGAVESLDVQSGRREVWKTIAPLRPALGGIRRLVVAPDGTMALGYEVARTDLYVIRGLR